jgi:dTMP kinase
MKKGMLIVIESGTDASGKATQAEILSQRLKDEKIKAYKVEFPNYKSDSSALIKMYLKGEFGENPEAINPYAASTFFAVDRFATYQKELKPLYESGGILISDRYTTSNMIYQSSKFENQSEKDEFLEWLWDLEFNKFNLPKPDYVIFLDIPPKISIELLKKRKEKIIDLTGKDIHEKNIEYINKTYENAKYIAQKYNWKIINCLKENGELKSIEEIHEEIYSIWLNIRDLGEV